MIKESYLMVDAIAQKDNVFTRMDARVKVIISVLALGSVIAMPGLRLPLAVFALAILSLIAVRTPVKLMMSRIVPPMIFGLFVFALMLFFRGSHQLFAVNPGSFRIVGYTEGFELGFVILTRIVASAAVLLFLSVTTPVHEMGYALVWLRVPKVIVEILLLTYRYIFVLWDEGMRIREAQTLRLGYPSWKRTSGWKCAFRSTATLMGMVIIRAYDRADHTFSAMQVRAYNGNIVGNGYKAWSRSQTGYLVSGLLLLVFLITVSL